MVMPNQEHKPKVNTHATKLPVFQAQGVIQKPEFNKKSRKGYRPLGFTPNAHHNVRGNLHLIDQKLHKNYAFQTTNHKSKNSNNESVFKRSLQGN